MSLFPGDAIIKRSIELAVEDLKKNDWIIEDIFSDFIENPMLNEVYGMKEITRAKEWIKNNKINYYMKYRIDTEAMPAITISMGASEEDNSLATLGDNTVDIETLDPSEIDKPIAFIVKPFDVLSYDKVTGIVEMPLNTDGYEYISEGMVAVDPNTGNGWVILDKAGTNGFKIAEGTELTVNQLAIVPKYQTYRARRERIISQEQYNIGCHVHGDPSTLLFLFHLVKYALLRYREGLLEHNNFQLSSIKCTDMIKNDAFQVDNVYSRYIILSGQVEEQWIKTPYRQFEVVGLKDQNSLNQAGIKIISNNNTLESSEEADNDLWITIDSE